MTQQLNSDVPELKRGPGGRHTVCAYIGVKDCPEILEQCLLHLDWVDEIVVGDFSSNDRIQRLCSERFIRVKHFFSTVDDGYKRFRSLLPFITSDYVLAVDADEVYTPELAAEILEELKSPCNYDGFLIPSISYNFGACWGDGATQLRLFHRLRHKLPLAGSVHGMPTVDGAVKTLKNPYHHHNNPKLGMNAVKHFRYEQINAERMSDSQLEECCLHEARGWRLHWSMLVALLRLNLRFVRTCWKYRRFGFGALCLAYSQIFQVIAAHVSATEEWRMRKGLIERGNRGYF